MYGNRLKRILPVDAKEKTRFDMQLSLGIREYFVECVANDAVALEKTIETGKNIRQSSCL